eukprot:506486-Alexandrium_andersonii.AAC.1
MHAAEEFLEAEFPGQTNKENREQRWHRFTSPGQPGEALRGHCDAFLAALRLPEEVVGTEAARGAGLHGKEAAGSAQPAFPSRAAKGVRRSTAAPPRVRQSALRGEAHVWRYWRFPLHVAA